MGQRQALLLATFLTTFGLVLIGAVAFRLTNAPDTAEVVVESTAENGTIPLTDTLPTTNTVATSATILTADDQAISDLMASREAAYEAALRQANEQLQAAYDQLAQVSGAAVTAAPSLPAPSNNAPAPAAPAPSAPAPAPAPAAPSFAVSPDSAAQIGLAAAPSATLNATPELVDFQGAIAYEVATSAGLVYVDANSGAVLFNGAAPAPVTNNVPAAPAPVAPTTVPLPPAPAPAPTNQISGDQAIAIAVGAVGPGEIDKIKLEEEHGILIWDIKFTNDNEVRVDAYTGAIVRTRIKNDNDDDRDDD